ncbi:hypothetical protein CLCAR_1681 [Clostridium carboxidivorans P7]|nr:hypothetical protein CLCAR_1681 [Clostridium carboxidivorans P7]
MIHQERVIKRKLYTNKSFNVEKYKALSNLYNVDSAYF